MNPTQPQAQALDPQVVALAKSIRTIESNNNFNQTGKSGESGAYQWMPGTWAAHAKEVLGDAKAQMTPANQNAVAYSVIKGWKDAGLNPAQIAAKWNSGSEVGWENKVGKNAQGVAYDVPAYVKKVTDTYQTLKPQANTPAIPGVSTAYADTGTNPAPAPTGNPQADALTKLTHFFNAIFPGKQVGEAIGTLAGYVASDNKEQYDTSAPSPLQVLGDVAQGALAVSGGPKAASVLGRIASSAVTGAGFGLTGAVAEGDTDIGSILHKTGTSALIGGALGTTAEAVSGIFNALPSRIAKNALKINPKVLENKPGTIEQALQDMKFGTKATMEKESQKLLTSYDDHIQEILHDPKFDGIKLKGTSAAEIVQEKLPDSNISLAQIKKTIKQVAPEVSGLLDTFMSEGLDMADANRLRSGLDKATRSVYVRTAVPPFSKTVTKTMADILRGAVQEGASETAPLFEKYTRELAIHEALSKIAQAPTFKVTMMDLLKVPFIHGATGLGTLPALGLQEAAQNRTVQLNAAKAISKVAPLATGAVKAATAPILTATSR